MGLLVHVEKFSVIKFAVILAMCIELHFVQLCKIWVKLDNLHFSLFHGVPPLDFLIKCQYTKIQRFPNKIDCPLFLIKLKRNKKARITKASGSMSSWSKKIILMNVVGYRQLMILKMSWFIKQNHLVYDITNNQL